MTTTRARATTGPDQRFEPLLIERRSIGSSDILIDIAYSGICHTDVSRARGEFGSTTYPLVPGHEIAGIVREVGSDVTRFAAGDRVGVGCMVDSCRECDYCRDGLEPYCRVRHVRTYNDVGRDGSPTHGGYSQQLVVDENYAVRIPDALSLHEAAPLLCAGITMYSPLKHWNAGRGSKIGVIGFGGLGHVGVSIAAALGAETTVFELDTSKEHDAVRRGAAHFRLSTDSAIFGDLRGHFDLILSTVPASLDYDAWLQMLALNGVLVNLGVPKAPITVDPFSLFFNRRSIAGTLVGGIAETQEMLDFCAEHGIATEVEVVDADDIDRCFDRVARGDVRYRFVIDAATI